MDVLPLSHLRGHMKGAALARIIMHTMQQNRGASIASPPPPSLCEGGLMQNHLKQHMAAPKLCRKKSPENGSYLRDEQAR